MAINDCNFYKKSFKRDLNAFHHNSSLFIQAIDQQYERDTKFTSRDDNDSSSLNYDTLSLTTASVDDENSQYAKDSSRISEDAQSVHSRTGMQNELLSPNLFIKDFLSVELQEKAFAFQNHSNTLKISSVLSNKSSFYYRCHKFKIQQRLKLLLHILMIQQRPRPRPQQYPHPRMLFSNSIQVPNCIMNIGMAYFHPYLIRIAY